MHIVLTIAMAFIVACGPPPPSGSGGSGSRADAGPSGTLPDAGAGQALADSFEEALKGTHVRVDASDGDHSQAGSGTVISATTAVLDIWLCSNMTFSLSMYEESCTGANIPGSTASSCSEDSDSATGTWEVVDVEGVPYLALDTRRGERWGLGLGWDGETLWVHRMPAETYENTRCN